MSCDPTFEETMKIANGTDKILTVIIEKKGDYTTYHKPYNFDYRNPFRDSCNIIGDTLLVVERNVQPDSELVLWVDGGVGYLSLRTKEDGIVMFNKLCDRFYLKNFKLKKDIKDFNNWNIWFDPEGGKGHDESRFIFEIGNNDISNL
jgi:hypothetical protein